MSGFRPTPGTEFLLDGKWYHIESYDPRRSCLVLVDADGVLTTISVDDLVHHPDLRVPDDKQAAIDLLGTLAPTERDKVMRRIEHVQEAMTGYRSGNAINARPGEPKPEYDPATTFKKDRYEAKKAELDNEFARRAGEYMSVPTMRRLARDIRDNTALEKSVNGSHRRRSQGRRTVPPVVEKQIVRFVDSHREGSNKTYKGMWISVRGMVAKKCGDDWTDKHYPSYDTFRRYLLDHWTKSELTGKARSRASATEAPKGGFKRMNPTRPGQLVLMDTNNLDVLLRGTRIEDAVRGSLVVAFDVYSRSPCAVRVVEQAEKGLDVSFAFLDIARPKPMMAGWPDEAQWPFAGLPDALIPVHGSYGGDEAISGMPFVNPEALGLDHGTSYKNFALRTLLERYHVDLLPARVRTGSDKAFIERFFGALRSMLLEHLGGYRGTDTSERGANVDNEVEWTAQALEDLICHWVVRIWQTHVLEDIKPPWCPEGDWTPNDLYEHGIATSGLAPRMMTSEDYYAALRTTQVKVQSRGVKVLGLWYDNDPDADEAVLDSRRNMPHPSGLKLWTVQYDRRDMRHVSFIDEHNNRHRLLWVGATGEFPCFSDRHINALRNRIGSSLERVDELTLIKVLLNEVLPTPDISETHAAATNREARKPGARASNAARDEQLARQDAAKYGVGTTSAVEPSAPPTATPSPLETKRRKIREAAAPGEVQPAPAFGTRRNRMLGPDYEEDAS